MSDDASLPKFGGKDVDDHEPTQTRISIKRDPQGRIEYKMTVGVGEPETAVMAMRVVAFDQFKAMEVEVASYEAARAANARQ
jgi:hypothetical protein